jgi:hypothetical protein
LLTEAAAPISCKTLARMLARLRAKPTSTNGHQRMLWVIYGYFTPLYEILWQNLVANATMNQWSLGVDHLSGQTMSMEHYFFLMSQAYPEEVSTYVNSDQCWRHCLDHWIMHGYHSHHFL